MKFNTPKTWTGTIAKIQGALVVTDPNELADGILLIDVENEGMSMQLASKPFNWGSGCGNRWRPPARVCVRSRTAKSCQKIRRGSR